MNDKIQVDLDEVKQVFAYLEDLNQFFHQPLHYQKIEDVESFLQNGGYEKISKMYYDIVWNWLPPETQHEIEENDDFVGGEVRLPRFRPAVQCAEQDSLIEEKR